MSYNEKIITEFRKNHGKVGGNFEGAPLLILHTKGARTGKPHVNPVMYLKDGDRLLVFASKGGADSHPDWFYNMKAHPEIEVEVGDDRLRVHAQELTGRERDRIYARQASLYPTFAQYQRQTKRIIPVVELKAS